MKKIVIFLLLLAMLSGLLYGCGFGDSETETTIPEAAREETRNTAAELSDKCTFVIIYRSVTGENLGSAIAEYPYGTTNTIMPPSLAGYISPEAQTVVCDSTSAETITFIYVPVAVPYTLVYRSSNGTELGTATVEYQNGTLNSITPPDFDGYVTPDAQTVLWDSVSDKTVTFTYSPAPVSNAVQSGYISSDSTYGLTYSAQIEYQNRTADSVQVRVVWTAALSGVKVFNAYGQRFTATIGEADTGAVIITNYGDWKSESSQTRSATAFSDWVTVPLDTTNATTVNMSIYYYQVDAHDRDVTNSLHASGLRTTWVINIPAY